MTGGRRGRLPSLPVLLCSCSGCLIIRGKAQCCHESSESHGGIAACIGPYVFLDVYWCWKRIQCHRPTRQNRYGVGGRFWHERGILGLGLDSGRVSSLATGWAKARSADGILGTCLKLEVISQTRDTRERSSIAVLDASNPVRRPDGGTMGSVSTSSRMPGRRIRPARA